MSAAPASVPVATDLLEGLRRQGYDVTYVALNPAFTKRPHGATTLVRFGKQSGDAGKDAAAEIDVTIDVLGNLSTRSLRRWRVTKTFALGYDCLQAIRFNAVVTLSGDLTAQFVGREGSAGCALMKSLLADIREALGDLKVARTDPPAQGLIAHLEMRVGGGIAAGRSGFIRSETSELAVTEEMRAARI
ncbi:unnamed protein product, partial [Phaeothamnion confervicola]